MTRVIKIGIIDIIDELITLTEFDDGTISIEIRGMHLSEDLSEWIFDEDPTATQD